MNKEEILQKANEVYEDLVRAWRENGQYNYDAGRVDGCLILIQELERFLPDSQNRSCDHKGEV